MELTIPGKTVFSHNQGSGYIHTDRAEIEKYVNPVPVLVVDETIQPNTETTLVGFFSRPLLYLGLAGDNEMIFYLGDSGDPEDLFAEKKYYYGSTHLIHRHRLFEMYTYISGRDYNWIDGRWK